MIVNKNVNFYYEKSQNFDIIEVSKIKEIEYYEHSSQLTAHADYVIGRVFCQALKQNFFQNEISSVFSLRERG